MIEAELNIFDVVVIAILSLSALIAFFRGFVRELLSLGAWIGAAIIALYSFPTVAEWIAPHVKNPTIANGFAGMLSFMGALIGLSIISAFLMKFMKPGKEVGMIDNVLGLAFGAARGALLVALGFYVMTFFFKENEYPEWIEEAKTKPYVEEIAGWMTTLVPEYLEDASTLEPKDGPLSDMLGSLPKPAREDEEDAAPIDDKESQWPDFEDLKRSVDGEGR